MSGAPKNGDGNPILGPELSSRQTTLNFGFVTETQEIARGIKILRQVFQMETQILIVISSPAFIAHKWAYALVRYSLE